MLVRVGAIISTLSHTASSSGRVEPLMAARFPSACRRLYTPHLSLGVCSHGGSLRGVTARVNIERAVASSQYSSSCEQYRAVGVSSFHETPFLVCPSNHLTLGLQSEQGVPHARERLAECRGNHGRRSASLSVEVLQNLFRDFAGRGLGACVLDCPAPLIGSAVPGKLVVFIRNAAGHHGEPAAVLPESLQFRDGVRSRSYPAGPEQVLNRVAAGRALFCVHDDARRAAVFQRDFANTVDYIVIGLGNVGMGLFLARELEKGIEEDKLGRVFLEGDRKSVGEG